MQNAPGEGRGRSLILGHRRRPRIGGFPRLGRMCVQCIAGATAAIGTATGARAWLVGRYGHLMTLRRKRAVTGVLLTAGVLASGLVGPTP